ncbi:hypothetical protein LTR09_005008 [Extremus antarcticus]|uniref:Autophagy-related protein 101 n=1 Tax=Extremus antarcticus TaxID=702011 RepID=A0AAJ0DNC6_9PEZI|nr:hypothetical protein LTR09_005008 [Extremus antarcticus]
MDGRRAPEYALELSADRSNIKDVVKGALHTIFFHRCFIPLQPATHDILELTLPYVSEDDIETLIEQRTNSFLRALDSASTSQSPQSQPRPGKGQLVVQFLEKKRRKGWFVAKADEETVWESWVIDVTLTSARSEPEAARNRRQMEKQLQTAAMAIIETANGEKDHIPPITSTDSNPFPYQILVNPKGDSQR